MHGPATSVGVVWPCYYALSCELGQTLLFTAMREFQVRLISNATMCACQRGSRRNVISDAIRRVGSRAMTAVDDLRLLQPKPEL